MKFQAGLQVGSCRALSTQTFSLQVCEGDAPARSACTRQRQALSELRSRSQQPGPLKRHHTHAGVLCIVPPLPKPMERIENFQIIQGPTGCSYCTAHCILRRQGQMEGRCRACRRPGSSSSSTWAGFCDCCTWCAASHPAGMQMRAASHTAAMQSGVEQIAVCLAMRASPRPTALARVRMPTHRTRPAPVLPARRSVPGPMALFNCIPRPRAALHYENVVEGGQPCGKQP